MADQIDKLRKELIFQLKGGHAHAKFDDVVKNFPEKLRGTVPEGMPYSAWQLLEHIRIAQDDILSYCKNSDGSYKEKKWPDDYWPKDPNPESAKAWTDSIKSYHADLDEFVELIGDPKSELFEAFRWGDGQTLFHEAMLLVDHAAYHLGEIVAVRRILKSWPAR
ncbi:MAG: DinB family protein [Terriglobia bacterium]|nr:DinB family protein [Terriglobia bacterium]